MYIFNLNNSSVREIFFFMNFFPHYHSSNYDKSSTVDVRNNLGSIGTKERNTKHYRLPTDDKNEIKLPTKTVGNNFAASNCTTIVYAVAEEDRVVVGFINEWINAYSFISSEYLYQILYKNLNKQLRIDLLRL